MNATILFEVVAAALVLIQVAKLTIERMARSD
jgi:hypothetical protein